MAYEEPSFKIVHQTDKYEIRHYKERLAVQSTYTNQNSSFRNLLIIFLGQIKIQKNKDDYTCYTT